MTPPPKQPDRWTIEQVAAVAPSPRSLAAAESLADTSRWTALGSDQRALWGRCRGSAAEPYDTMVDHRHAAWACTCPSRKLPCKHALALLMLWVRGMVPATAAPEPVARWIVGRDARAGRADGAGNDDRPNDGAGDCAGDGADNGADAATPDRDEIDRDEIERDEIDRDETERERDERVARMLDGLNELDRWIEDRMRTGLADPALADYATWDSLAARLVDARAGSLANRVRRLAGLVGAGPDWHSAVLAELALLHLIAQGGRRLRDLPADLGDAVAVASGWQVRQADVLAGVAETDRWLVAGRSDVREHNIDVRRHWLYGTTTRRWAMLLSFAAYQQSLDDSWQVGTIVNADLHRYPGNAIRALAGRRDAAVPLRDPGIDPPDDPLVGTVAQACASIGGAVAAEPWHDRYPAVMVATPTFTDRHWVVSDATGAVPLVARPQALATVLAASAGAPVAMTVEWNPAGVQPLTVFTGDRALDVGPRTTTQRTTTQRATTQMAGRR